MIIAKAPFRISFFGGGTDYQPFFQEHGGSVLSTSIDKYTYVTTRHLPRFFDYSSKITYSSIEEVKSVEEIKHPLVREAMKFLDMQELHLSHDADLPARSGLGSSSAFACALLQAFHGLKGHYRSPYALAKEAIYVERVLCKEDGGWQDQIASAYGGFNRIDFRGEDFTVSPVLLHPQRKQELNENLMMFFTGFVRYSSEIAKAQVKATEDKSNQLKEMCSLVEEAHGILVNKHSDLDEFGRLLHHTWQLKRSLTSRITTEEIDGIYETARKQGALGGKLLGAGGGGFILFYVPKEKQEAVKKALHPLLHVPFQFEEGGAQILYYKPEEFKVREKT